MNIMKSILEDLSPERLAWEVKKGFKIFCKSPAPVIVILQLAAMIFVSSKGAGKIYLDMILPLLFITVFSWILTSAAQGNFKILMYTLMLLTVGTILQCIFKQENVNQVLARGDKILRNPAFGLQVQYLAGLFAAVFAGYGYRKWNSISSTKWCRRFVIISVGISIITLGLATAVGGVKNWISIGGISIQTTEITKFLYLFIAAGLLAVTERPSRNNIIAFYVITGIDIAFLAVQGEFGTMLLVILLFFVYLFLFVPGRKQFLITLAGFLICCAIFIGAGLVLTALRENNHFLGTNTLSRFYLRNFDKIADRYRFWQDPLKYRDQGGYQLLQARNCIYLGGWIGTSTLINLPVHTSDMVYPSLILRCGMVFAILVLFMFILLWSEGVRLAVRKRDSYHCALAMGIIYMFFFQSLIIIGGSTGLCPLTGITLPFISSGGTSLMISSAMIGLLISISGNVQWKGNDDREDEFFKTCKVFTKCSALLRHHNADRISPDIGTSSRRVGRRRSEKDEY